MAAIKFWSPRLQSWTRYEVMLKPLRVCLQGEPVGREFIERLPTALHEGGPVRFEDDPEAWLESIANMTLSHMAVEK